MRKLSCLFLFFLCLGLVSRAFCISVDPDLVVKPNIAWQGKTLTVKLISPEGIAWVKGRFLGQDFVCYKADSDFRGIIGVPLDQKPGHYDLSLYIYNKDGTLNSLHRRIKVWSTKFPFSRFWLRPSKRKLMTRELIEKEWAMIEKVLLMESPAQLWKGRFLRPVKGRVSQGFGHRQIINGRRAGSHRGVDFAVFNGTEIKAPNRGKVVFARRLKAFGGTLVLDHGQGIYTLYFHLSKINPKVGQAVKKGEVIGLSGDSGISSGPHLHWGMSVHNLRVDPMQWVKHEI
jgi:hypothetical protein